MTISDIDAFSAELDAILAAAGFSAPVRGVDPALLSADVRADPVADTRPQTVTELMRALPKSAQAKKPFCDPDYDGGQYADGTYPNLHDSQFTKHENEESPSPSAPNSSPTAREDCSCAVYRIASSRPQPSQELLSTQPLRKPRRVAAQLDRVAVKKSWSGTKSKGLKDRLTNTEKFVAAIWSTAAVKGVAVSLNLGVQREGMLLKHSNPRRRMMQTLQHHLSEAGFGDLPYVSTAE